ncbi:MAG TPA: hypothetical protein PK823_17915, partial [Novosphingobium sp.]|nr:hypothetical protein [Novosphingobium sp.]
SILPRSELLCGKCPQALANYYMSCRNEECIMASTIGKFYFECDAQGGVLKAVSTLSARCLTDEEVDEYVKMLKDDLDSVSKKLKRAIRDRPRLIIEHDD